MDLVGKNVLIIGKGASGINSAMFIKENGGNPYIYDDFDYSPCEIKQISFTEVIRQLPRLDFGIISPGIALDNRLIKSLKKNKFLIISELDFAYLQSDTKIIAVTGTNGKTTTVSLTSKLLADAGYKAVAVGNIGVPFVSWCKWLGVSDVAVVEVSSFQLEHSDCFRADIATITNITEDHLDRHGNFDIYKKIKLKIFNNLKSTAVINADGDNYNVNCDKFTYSITNKNADVFVEDNNIYYNFQGQKQLIINVNELNIKGEHNLYNALCAISLSISYCKTLPDSFYNTLKTFSLPKYRVECLGTVCGINIFNDSKGTNIGATLCAIRSMKGSTLLIMGGYDKRDNYKAFFDKLDDKITRIHLVGANTASVIEGAIKANKENIINIYDSLENAVDAAFNIGCYNNLLFSPATSSYDAFYDYKQRGRAFEELIEKRRE